MSNDETSPFDFAAAFQQILQGQNEIMRRLSLVEGRLLALEQPPKTDEYHRPQAHATADWVTPTQQMYVFTSDLVTPTQQMYVFPVGLSDPLCTDVELHKHSDLPYAMSLASAFEHHYHTTPATSCLPKPFEMMMLLAPLGTGPYQRSLCRLTPVEMADRRQKGLCFNCDELYTRGHKRKRLLWLKVVDGDDHENSSLLITNEAPG